MTQRTCKLKWQKTNYESWHQIHGKAHHLLHLYSFFALRLLHLQVSCDALTTPTNCLALCLLHLQVSCTVLTAPPGFLRCAYYTYKCLALRLLHPKFLTLRLLHLQASYAALTTSTAFLLCAYCTSRFLAMRLLHLQVSCAALTTPQVSSTLYTSRFLALSLLHLQVSSTLYTSRFSCAEFTTPLSFLRCTYHTSRFLRYAK